MQSHASKLRGWFERFDVPTTFLIALSTAFVGSFVVAHMGEASVLLGPAFLAYFPCFGYAFLSAVARSRFLPRREGSSFFIPVLCAVLLVFSAALLGFHAAGKINETIYGRGI